jgi:SAM-dependent methyltransferase
LSYFTFGHRLPHFLSAPLFGDRRQFGLVIRYDDPDWVAWQTLFQDFYQDTQKEGIGKTVNDAGYSILKQIDFQDKSVLEFGPGILPHYRFWNGKPRLYTIIDNQQEMLNKTQRLLEEKNISVESYLVDSHTLPVPDHQIDIILAFYSLEHLNPLGIYLDEMKRVLKPGGFFVGGIPTEGGLAWGTGRFLTSRRYIRHNSPVNPDKIICWEHPNFADEILTSLDKQFDAVQRHFWPFSISSIDFNLIVSFIYQSRMEE